MKTWPQLAGDCRSIHRLQSKILPEHPFKAVLYQPMPYGYNNLWRLRCKFVACGHWISSASWLLHRFRWVLVVCFANSFAECKIYEIAKARTKEEWDVRSVCFLSPNTCCTQGGAGGRCHAKSSCGSLAWWVGDDDWRVSVGASQKICKYIAILAQLLASLLVAPFLQCSHPRHSCPNSPFMKTRPTFRPYRPSE